VQFGGAAEADIVEEDVRHACAAIGAFGHSRALFRLHGDVVFLERDALLFQQRFRPMAVGAERGAVDFDFGHGRSPSPLE